MKFRSTGLLLVIFVIFAGYVYFVEMRKSPAAVPEDKSTWVLTLAATDVQQLQVDNSGKTIILARNGDNWSIGSVNGPAADNARVGSLVASLVDLRSTRVLTNTTESLSAFGLDQPPITITLTLENNTQEVLFVGDKNPQGYSYYLQRKGQTPVHLVPASTVDDLTGLITDLPLAPTPTVAPAPTAPPAAPGSTTTP
jgi:hypothetical protein